jgi:phage gpG-like protein
MATIVISTKGFEESVAGLVKRAIDYRPALQVFGADMLRSITKNFEAQGRPEPWKPLKPGTILARYTRRNSTNKRRKEVYKDAKGRTSGALSAVQTANGGLALGRSGKTFTRGAIGALMNAKILDDNGDLKASIRYDVANMALRLGTNKIYGRTHQLGDSRRNIAARPYLVYQAEDRLLFRKILIAHLRGEL